MRVDTNQLSGLECVLGQSRLLIAVDWIHRIIEYEVTPLPLCRPYVGGLGSHAGQVIVSIGLRRHAEIAARSRRAVKGVLLGNTRQSLDWAVEIDDTIAFAQFTLPSSPTTGLPAPAFPGTPWVFEVPTSDGRTVGWLDVDRLLSDLGAAATSLRSSWP